MIALAKITWVATWLYSWKGGKSALELANPRRRYQD